MFDQFCKKEKKMANKKKVPSYIRKADEGKTTKYKKLDVRPYDVHIFKIQMLACNISTTLSSKKRKNT